MGKKILLIQPHSDDILFSASKYLFDIDDGDSIVLFTVEPDPKRLAEDIALVELLGLTDLETTSKDFIDSSYYHYYKEMKCKTFNIREAEACMKQCYSKSFLFTLEREIIEIVKRYKKLGFTIITCLGIGHPMHWFVREAIGDLADIHYRDFPHSYKRKGLEEFEKVSKGKLMMEHFDETEHTLKFDIAKKIYKTQSSLLFFEQGYIKKKIAEEYYFVK